MTLIKTNQLRKMVEYALFCCPAPSPALLAADVLMCTIHTHTAEHKKVVLGTKPILLSPFVSGGQHNIFAASDRPTIVYSSNRKLLYSNINENEVSVCPHMLLHTLYMSSIRIQRVVGESLP